MTAIIVEKANGKILSVEASGHTGYAESGEDIVCAALSAIIQTAALGLTEVAKIAATIDRNDEDGYFRLTLPSLGEEKRHEADLILETALCGITDIAKSYTDFIKLEVK